MFSNLWFVLAAVVLGIFGIIYMRRRQQQGEDDGLELEAAPAPDAFADVELTEQALEVEEEAEPPKPAAESEKAAEEEVAGDSRGYGQHRHDEYASDEASDALAEAEIYIAYGRYPQAIDLLKNALANDSGNSAYRLKLLQLHIETGDRNAASKEFAELEAIGDSASISAARAAMAEGSEEPAPAAENAPAGRTVSDADLLSDRNAPLESDFTGLEIEQPGALDMEDELDLSADFDAVGLGSEQMGEDLVIAAESNGMSTKLDLARAYMDMGDDDGARQILDEVAAEGNAELQAEARALLERIG